MKIAFVICVAAFVSVGCKRTPEEVRAAPETRVMPDGFAFVHAETAETFDGSAPAIWLGARSVHLAPATPALITAAPGEIDFPPSEKPNGVAADLRLPKLQAALTADAGTGMIVHVDGRATYRMLVDVVYTLLQAGVAPILVGVNGGRVLPINVPKFAGAPKLGPIDADGAPELSILVIVTSDGYSMKVNGANVAEGCAGVGPGPAIRGHDKRALRECMQKQRGANPAYANTTSLTLSANAGVPLQHVIDAWDSARAAKYTDMMLAMTR